MTNTQKLLDFFMRHWTLSLGILVTLALLIREELKARLFAKHILTPEETAIESKRGTVICDVRDKTDYINERIENSQWLKFDKLSKTPEKVLKPDIRYVFYCNDGSKSGELAMFLKQKHGFNVSCIEGGLTAWKEHGFNCNKESVSDHKEKENDIKNKNKSSHTKNKSAETKKKSVNASSTDEEKANDSNESKSGTNKESNITGEDNDSTK